MSFEDLLSSVEMQAVETNEPQASQGVQNQGSTAVATSNPVQALPARKEVDLSKFSPSDLQTLNKIKNEFDISGSNGISHFGADVQASIAKFADGLLDGVKTKDTGVVGNSLTDLMMTIKGIDMEKLQEKDSFMSKIPFLKSLANSASSTRTKLENVTDTVDKIVLALDTSRKELIRDINILDALYNKNMEYLHNLELCIAAGELKYNELSDTVLVELRDKAQASADIMDTQKYNDFARMLNEMEKRIFDLKLSREIAIQTMPQIRIIQGNDKILSNKIQSSILTTIPIWKNQMALTISLNKQKTALELQKKVSDTTEDLLKQNAELLKMNSIEIARESERGIISIETLRETHTKLIETIEESMKIYDEGRQNRIKVESELSGLESNLKQRLLAIKGN